MDGDIFLTYTGADRKVVDNMVIYCKTVKVIFYYYKNNYNVTWK